MTKGQPQVIDAAGRPVGLGAVVGQGGEGAVYEVAGGGGLVAKVYHKPLSADRADKVRAMGALGDEALRRLAAWPVGLLMDRASGHPVGLLMPRVVGRKDIHQLYSPKSRRSEFARADWRFLVRAAANTARAFAAVHQAGCVIGDVNHGGVLVGQDATVTLIDCDSFQVVHGGRRFLCEVGVETFTPPELQARSFQGIVRTAVHDEFGLAVMVFLLLFMGRHPFAGRFAGPGDMPIARAIEEHRFAYGRRRAALQMIQPPGTPALSTAGPQVSELFERAFAPDATTSGRPTAREWIASLEALECELGQCASNPSHWHRKGSPCPWCSMEGATGVALFPAVVQQAAGTVFDLTRLWQEIESVRHPGNAPVIAEPVPEPSDAALRLAGWGTKRHAIAMAGAVPVALFGLAFGPVMLLAAGVIYLVILAATDRAGEAAPIRAAHEAASSHWDAAEREWLLRAGPSLFEQQKAALVGLRDEWNRVPAMRTRMLGELERDRERAQRLRFLDGFEIVKAKVEGIGKGRKHTLASYGVETAADVTQTALAHVPGFGPKMQSRLLAWRASVEARFVFDPNRHVDPRDVAKVECDVLARRTQIEGGMNTGLAELRRAKAQIEATRQHLLPRVVDARRQFLQATADRDAIS